MKVAELWRYPVKTMAGEMLRHAAIGPLGIEGDRVVHIEAGEISVGDEVVLVRGRACAESASAAVFAD